MSPGATIIILGKGRSASVLESWVSEHPGAELWTLNGERHRLATRHFEIHRPRHHLTLDLRIPCLVHWETEQACEVEEHFPIVELAVAYPRAAHYLNSTIAYMLAYAALQRPARVLLPGVDFTGAPIEFHEQRRCAEFWIGVLTGQGCEVIIPPESALLHGYLYD